MAYQTDGAWFRSVLLWVLVPAYALLALTALGAGIAGVELPELLDVAQELGPLVIGVTLLAVVAWRWVSSPHHHTG